MDQKIKDYIDNMNYAEMLRQWRFAEIDTLFFQGETGDYFVKVMKKKREQMGLLVHTATSERIGW